MQISKFKLKDEVLAKLFYLFFEVVGKKSNEKEFFSTITGILSPTERVMIAKRIAIIYLLMQGVRHEAICKTLKVSSATVAKFALLSNEDNGAVQSLKKILKNEKVSLFILEMFSSLLPPGSPGISWKAAWSRKTSLIKKKATGL